jgi:hypothetical protein
MSEVQNIEGKKKVDSVSTQVTDPYVGMEGTFWWDTMELRITTKESSMQYMACSK